MVKRSSIPVQPAPEPKRSPRKLPWLGGLLLLSSLLLWFSTQEPSKELDPQRAAKLQKELEELENAEQYVLLASQNTWYPCFPCTGKKRIFLLRGQVWKYGVTRKGEAGRYGKSLAQQNLIYVRQYQGPWQECLKQEKIKIYNYAVHPENLAREQPLIRPPGNKQDN